MCVSADLTSSLRSHCMFIGARMAGSFPFWRSDLSLCLRFPFCEMGGAAGLVVRTQS